MKAMRRSTRPLAGWMTVLTLCGALGAATAAHAESLRIGTVLGVPVSDLENFRRANTTIGRGYFGERVPANDVTVLHISTVAAAPIRDAIATVSLTQQGTHLKAWRVYFPLQADDTISPLYQYINARDSFTNPRRLATGFGAVLQVDVRQEDTGAFNLDAVRFMMLPEYAYGGLVTENPRARISVVHTQRMTNNFGFFSVQLVAIDAEHARALKIPKEMLTMVTAFNSNLRIGPGNLAEAR